MGIAQFLVDKITNHKDSSSGAVIGIRAAGRR
jgi:hypothetical protein